MTKVSNGLWTNLCRKKEEPNKSFSSEYALDEEDKQHHDLLVQEAEVPPLPRYFYFFDINLV